MTQTGQKRKQEQAIQALLTTATIGEAAAQCGVAVDVLATVAGDAEAPASARANAARAIIQLALDANTAENLEARIAQLERNKKP